LLAAVEKHLGVEVRPVTTKEAERYGLDLHQGVTIIHVAPHGALGKAGFEVQDIVLAVDR
jgi:S1-C subfamily serine protease